MSAADTVQHTAARAARRVSLDVETVALLAIVALNGLAWAGLIPVHVGWIEALATITGAASVWLLARNNVWGWWVGLVSVALFGVLFYGVRLFAEVGIQGFYVITSVYGVWLWARAGERGDGVAVRYLPRNQWLWIVPTSAAAWFALNWLLVTVEGSAPFWDSLTAVMSILAQLLLMARFVDSWWIWIAVDVIYVPLFLWKGLTLTAALYVCFLVIAAAGLMEFRRLAAVQVTVDG